MRSVEEIEEFLTKALDSDARGRLVDRGEARAIVRRDGVMPSDAPIFAKAIDADLTEYGFSILDAALELRIVDRQHDQLEPAFYMVGRVFEALVKYGDPKKETRGFYRVIAAASFHLAGYAAIAFSLFSALEEEKLNLNQAERGLIRLLLRDLEGIRKMARSWILDPAHGDEAISSQLKKDRDSMLALIVQTGVFRALAYFEFALQTGEEALIIEADRLLAAAYGIAENTGLVTLWWIVRITRSLIADLWLNSLHKVIPLNPTSGSSQIYSDNRKIFISSLVNRSIAEVELWPSQINAAQRAADPVDDLVVSLPTSAGKTRIAELATLTCLSLGKRVLFITPLRALSAQTESSFQTTFAPLGISVSSLYGKSGLSSGDSNALKTDEIVVATPEKLDFALRSDPDIINDIGLIVLDEGHMIGPREREVHYEILVQRILRRKDADSRRIVCLSAILPKGQELDDMTAWIRSDALGDPIRSEWRPTKQRFGTLEWNGTQGTLHYDLEDDGPFVSRFLNSIPAISPEQKDRPRNIKDITLMGAWRFAEEGKRVLIFVTQANWVEGFASRAIDLVDRGYLNTLLKDKSEIQDAINIGSEWLGKDHPAVVCLGLGIAVHHGGLPSPFLREVEQLLSSGKIWITVASPTLSQGLNINAAVLLVPYLVRSRIDIKGEEFANVAGRAGRAFVDTEGLILHVIYDKHDYRKRQWGTLIEGIHTRSLRSGLMIIIDEVIKRMMARGIENSQLGYEFLANSREDWLVGVNEDDTLHLEELIPKLDAIIFGLIEALDADSEDLPSLLDEALRGSLWARQITKSNEKIQLIILRTRARLIWNTTTSIQRRGYFTMGVGLETGLKIDGLAEQLSADLDHADLAALQGDLDALYAAIISMAEHLLLIKPFAPVAENILSSNWKKVLRQWLEGQSIAIIGTDNIKLIEDVFVYRLVWAIEAIRMRRIAHGWKGGELVVDGFAAACLDTGLPDYRMSMLVRAGLTSREIAKRVILELNPSFLDRNELKSWLNSPEVKSFSERKDWPTTETSSLWQRFQGEVSQDHKTKWSISDYSLTSLDDASRANKVFRIINGDAGHIKAVTPDYRKDIIGIKDLKLPKDGLGYGGWLDDGRAYIKIIGSKE